jgi:hypothetical protein
MDNVADDDLPILLTEAILSRDLRLFSAVMRKGVVPEASYFANLHLLGKPDVISAIDILRHYPQPIPQTYDLLNTPIFPLASSQVDLEAIVEVGLRLFDPNIRNRLFQAGVEALQRMTGLTLPNLRELEDDLLGDMSLDHPLVGMARKSRFLRHCLARLYSLIHITVRYSLRAPHQLVNGGTFLTSDSFCYGVGKFLTPVDLCRASGCPALLAMVKAQCAIRLGEMFQAIPTCSLIGCLLYRLELLSPTDVELLMKTAIITRNSPLLVTLISPKTHQSLIKVAKELSSKDTIGLDGSSRLEYSHLLSITDILSFRRAVVKTDSLITPILLYHGLSDYPLSTTNHNQSWGNVITCPTLTNIQLAVRNLAYAKSVQTGGNFAELRYRFDQAVMLGTDHGQTGLCKERLDKLRQLYSLCEW